MNAQSFKHGCLKAAALSCHTMWQPKRLTRHDAKPAEQARRARMHDSGRTESAQGRADPNDRNSTTPPHYTFARSTSGVLFLVRRGANSHCAGKARMPYKMNAQSFKQGCLKSAALSCYARMHNDSHTEPLHDATAQMAVIAQMQRHKWLSLHRCNGTNGCHCTDATAQMAVDAQMWQPKWLTRQGCLQEQLIQFLMQSVDKLQQYIAKSV